MPAIKQDNAALGFDGEGSPAGGAFVFVNIEYNASSVDKVSFVATRQYVVKAITARPTVAGTDGSAVTAVIKKAASGTAITSGTALHSSTVNLKGTADTIQSLTVTEADATIPAGTAIGIDFTGTLTSATGVVTVCMVVA